MVRIMPPAPGQVTFGPKAWLDLARSIYDFYSSIINPTKLCPFFLQLK